MRRNSQTSFDRSQDKIERQVCWVERSHRSGNTPHNHRVLNNKFELISIKKIFALLSTNEICMQNLQRLATMISKSTDIPFKITFSVKYLSINTLSYFSFFCHY